jgi:hypothetical protein
LTKPADAGAAGALPFDLNEFFSNKIIEFNT